MRDLFELLLDGFVVDIVIHAGIRVRWVFFNFVNLLRSHPTIAYKKFSSKFERDRDPSNVMSNRMIHLIMGVGSVFSVSLLIIYLFDHLLK